MAGRGGSGADCAASWESNIGGPLLETHQHRMRYAQFRAQGYPIGSGTVESAVKGVIAARLKQAGMRWTKAGAQAALNLRTHLLNGRWYAIWSLTHPQPSPA